MIHLSFPGTLRLVLYLMAPFSVFGQSSNTPELMGEAINSEYNEIGPVISPDGKTLFFSRISHPQNTHGENGSQDIWYSEFRNNRWSNAVRMPNIVNKDVYNAIYSITPDGNTILLKGSYNKGVYQTRGFSISKRVRRSWSAPETIEIPDYEKLSKGEFDCGFLSNDGQTLIMSFSEKKKGRNDDLYVSFKDKEGKWSRPQSLGHDVNTPAFMETTPFLAADGLTLYFSSDRPGGHGGNDIYSSRRLDASWKKWTKPINLGPAVNTPGFEGYYTVAAAGDYAYWSSNEPGKTKKGDVYRLSLKKQAPADSLLKKPDLIAEKKDQTLPDPVVMISGKVLDNKTGKPVEAMVMISSFPDGKEMGTATTDPETGEYKFTLPYGNTYSFRPVVPGFIAEAELIDLTDSTAAKVREKNLLIGDRSARVSAVDSVSGKKEVVGLIADKGNKDKPGGTGLAADKGNKDKPAGTGLAADKGKSKPAGDTTAASGKTAAADTVKTGMPAGKDRLARGDAKDTPGKGDGSGVAGGPGVAKDTASLRTYKEVDKSLKVVPVEVGGVVRLNNIFFETAHSRLRPESRMELDQMVETLKQYPTMHVELSGHTDSEGTEASNKKLSQDRSNAVRTYLVEKGIDPARVRSVGYGESRPVATNDTPEGRQANRRVEFTILQK